MHIDPTEYYTLKPLESKLSKKQIGFLVVVLAICLLVASHYDYLTITN